MATLWSCTPGELRLGFFLEYGAFIFIPKINVTDDVRVLLRVRGLSYCYQKSVTDQVQVSAGGQ